jgi:arginine repressor
MSMLGKPQRQHRILRILEQQPVSSQAQMVQLLEGEGIVATQATSVGIEGSAR